MNTRRVIAICLWLWFLGGAVWQGLSPMHPMLEQSWKWDAAGFVVAVLPLVFFATGPLWQKRHPFDVPTLRIWTNKRFGAGTFESYVHAIKPVLLFAVSFCTLGIVLLLASIYRGAAAGAYVMAVFYLSASAGTFIARALLGRQVGALE